MTDGTARAFVAGATGLTGRTVVSELRKQGVPTIAHVRPDSRELASWRARFEELRAEVDTTPWEEGALTAALLERAPSVVFALLGTTKKRARAAAAAGRDPAAESYERVDYGLTAMLRRACEGSGHGPRFVYLSAVGVSDRSGNPYYTARARIERELREGALPYTVVRPSFITGPREDTRPAESAGAVVTDALVGVAGVFGARRLRDRYRSIQVEDLARALVRLALDPSADNRVVEGDALR